MKEIVVNPIFVSNTKKIRQATIKTSSPYRDINASFNWLKVDFPFLHTHNHWEILIVLKGKLKHTINGQCEVCTRGYSCLIRPSDCHCLHYYDENKDVQYINFTFSEEIAQKFLSLYSDYSFNLQENAILSFTLENALIDYLIKNAMTAQSLPKKEYEQYSILLINQLLSIFFSQKIFMSNTYPGWLNEFLYYLHNPKCFSLSAKALSAKTPFSYSRLSRLFKMYIGKSLIEYINELKIVYAKKELRMTQKKIIEISMDLGYYSVSSFNHIFKEATTLTPLQYRKQHAAIK